MTTTDSAAMKLLCCPFCGAEAKMVSDAAHIEPGERPHHRIFCSNKRCRARVDCRADHAEIIDADTAIRAWNTRALTASPARGGIDVMRIAGLCHEIIDGAKHRETRNAGTALCAEGARKILKELERGASEPARGGESRVDDGGRVVTEEVRKFALECIDGRIGLTENSLFAWSKSDRPEAKKRIAAIEDEVAKQKAMRAALEAVMGVGGASQRVKKEDSRCARCGWPLAPTVADGCVRGNCSYRPEPPLSRHQFYDAERWDRELAEASKVVPRGTEGVGQ